MVQKICGIRQIKSISRSYQWKAWREPRTNVRGLFLVKGYICTIISNRMAASFRNKIKSLSPHAYWREILAVLMLLLAFMFFRSERKELFAIIPQIEQANPFWIFAGVLFTVIYFFLQGGMYRKSFILNRNSNIQC